MKIETPFSGRFNFHIQWRELHSRILSVAKEYPSGNSVRVLPTNPINRQLGDLLGSSQTIDKIRLWAYNRDIRIR